MVPQDQRIFFKESDNNSSFFFHKYANLSKKNNNFLWETRDQNGCLVSNFEKADEVGKKKF
jgi:hypothetical protein